MLRKLFRRQSKNHQGNEQSIYEYAQIKSDDAKLTNANYEEWKYVLPIPPTSLVQSVGGPTLENFFIVGEAWSHVVKHFLRDKSTILDIGCGCGKTARHLVNDPRIKKYIGFDVVKESTDWSTNFITPFSSNLFEFQFFNIFSKTYNPKGTIFSRNFEFPAKDNSIDIAIAASLFTHLLEEDIPNYLKQTARVLKKDGVAIYSFHNKPVDGDYSGDEVRANISNDYFEKLGKEAGLVVKEKIGKLCGQETFIFTKK